MKQRIIDLINKYSKNKVYNLESEIYTLPTKMSFKFQILGQKEMYWIGEPYPTVSVKITIISTNETLKKFLEGIRGQKLQLVKIFNNLHQQRQDTEEYISDIIKFFGSEYDVNIDEVVIEENKENIMESEEYNNFFDKIVGDITEVVKTLEEGEFQLPEDVGGDMTYVFTNFDNEFDVEINITHDENIPDFYIDGGYYEEEDVFTFDIVYNPKKYPSFLYEFNGEMNEVLAHEFNHMLQYLRGEEYKSSNDQSSREYYLRPDEIDSQYFGFKRQSRVTNIPFEVVVRNWFNKYGEMRGLSEEDIEIIIYEILNYKK